MSSIAAIFNEQTIKCLSDKNIEKRRQASADIIDFVKDLLIREEQDESKEVSDEDSKEDFEVSESKILKIIKYFEILVADESAQKRRSGLYGLASISIAMYDYKGQNFVEFMVNPVLSAFGDREPKVQLAACDAMFNILKYLRRNMQSLHNETKISMFEILSKTSSKSFIDCIPEIISVVSNPNNDVKDWGKKLIELLEDIVYTTIIHSSAFDIESLFEKILNKLLKSK